MHNVHVLLNATLWRTFRLGCLQRGMTATAMLRTLITTQLAAWQATEKDAS